MGAGGGGVVQFRFKASSFKFGSRFNVTDVFDIKGMRSEVDDASENLLPLFDSCLEGPFNC